MNDIELTVDTIAELQNEIATQREVICNLNAMNDELQAKLDEIEQLLNENGYIWSASVYERLKEILGKE